MSTEIENKIWYLSTTVVLRNQIFEALGLIFNNKIFVEGNYVIKSARLPNNGGLLYSSDELLRRSEYLISKLTSQWMCAE